ncbi:YoaK family protein [Herbidospora mongoliensis]|uniref:YoaK family protein n=1 Tax=Herbidospora mongoliensis TaxID=688067 RepID=UPI00082EB922|nr:YoaK family protein [Herbidospora mongoliensis]
MRIMWGTTALACCAGAVDLLTFKELGGAFAGIITGNVVTAASGQLTAALTAVGGFGAGAYAWVVTFRDRRTFGLIAELVLLVVVAIGWIGTGTHPDLSGRLVLLALAGIAMGGQSAMMLGLEPDTTYMTGVLTTSLRDLATGRRDTFTAALRQIGALVVGAALTAWLLVAARPFAPVLAVMLLISAIFLLPRTRPDGS